MTQDKNAPVSADALPANYHAAQAVLDAHEASGPSAQTRAGILAYAVNVATNTVAAPARARDRVEHETGQASANGILSRAPPPGITKDQAVDAETNMRNKSASPTGLAAPLPNAALFAAIRSSDAAAVQQALANGADKNAKSNGTRGFDAIAAAMAGLGAR